MFMLQLKTKLGMTHRDESYVLVAALDLGTTYSGYAFSFRTEPEKVICNSNWGEEYGFKVNSFMRRGLTIFGAL